MNKTDPAVIISRHKICEMLPSSFPSILYHQMLPLSRLRKNSESAIWTFWHLRYEEKFSIAAQVSNIFVVGRRPQIYKNGLTTGVKFGGDAVKSGRNTHLLVIMRVRILQKLV